MDPTAVLVTVATAVLGLVGYILLSVLGMIAVEETADALGRRPAFAERRTRHRGLMKSGMGLLLLAATSGWLWLAAATSGYEDTADDARVLGLVTAALAVAGCLLLGLWWRRAGAPRHS